MGIVGATLDTPNITLLDSSRPETAIESDNDFTAPIFTCDDATSRCECCQADFVLFLRINPKHHCRACGKLICGRCSSQKVQLWRSSMAPFDRVCDPCFKVISNRASLRSNEQTRAMWSDAGEAAASLAIRDSGVVSSAPSPSTATECTVVAVIQSSSDSLSPRGKDRPVQPECVIDDDDPCAQVLDELALPPKTS